MNNTKAMNKTTETSRRDNVGSAGGRLATPQWILAHECAPRGSDAGLGALRRTLSKTRRPFELMRKPRLLFFGLAVSALLLLWNSAWAGVTLTVVDDAGNPVTDFRWQLQEDISMPGVPYVQTNNTVSIVSHRSDSRILAFGRATASTWPIRVPKYTWPDIVPPGIVVAGAAGYVMATNNTPYNNSTYDADPDPTQKYFIQVLASGYQMGGMQIPAGVSGTFKLVINRDPLPTTQISVLVFNDNLPLNNEPDSEEDGLPGFRILMFDFNGAICNQDAFANPVGTTYLRDTNGNFLMDDSGHYLVDKMGDGFIYTDKDGKALIQNMYNSVFAIMAIPPTGEKWVGGHSGVKNVDGMRQGGFQWQDNTIEGTPWIDAWAQANGSRVFIEGWGSGFYHVFFGFVDPDKLPGCAPAPGSKNSGVTVKGRLVVNHYGRPPQTAVIAAGQPVKDGWVGLNIADPTIEGAAPVEGVDMALVPANRAVWAQACDPETGEFSIANVAPGYYTLASWDRPLDMIFNTRDVAVPTNGSPGVVNGVYDIGDILQVRWFGTMQGTVFYDANGNGFPDPGEETLPHVPVNTRFRDGSLYQMTSTVADGTYNFLEVFPFFKWLVAEVDNSRWRPSGVTAVVDDGGVVPAANGWAVPSGDVVDPTLAVRNPQPQYDVNADGTINLAAPLVNPNTGNNLSRTQVATNDTQPLYTQTFQNYNGQNSRLDFGKQVWGPGTNGGISGVVIYKTMRAEDDPRFAFQDPYDPCVARAQVTLYDFETNYYALASNHAAHATPPMPTVDGWPADINLWKIKIHRAGATYPRLADVDNYPFGWSTGGTRGPEDVDRDDPTHTLLPDTHPFNPGDAIQIVHSSSWDDTVNANLNPAFPGAGGWPQGTISPTPPVIVGRPVLGSDNFATWEQIRPGLFDGMYAINSYHPGGIASGSAEVMHLPAADYIVQCAPPPGQYVMTEESQNDWTGDTYQPGKLDLQPECMGDYHLVPPWESLFGLNANPPQYVPANYGNQWRALADRKLATVNDGRNLICNFHVYSEVAKAAHVVGFVLQDLSAEFDPNNPIYGERDGAAWIPVSIRDWAGHEIAHSYSDEFGCYDLMVSSSYTCSMPSPASFAPNIATVILNDPTMAADPRDLNGTRVSDPYWNPAIGVAPVPLDYWPGKVNYADTPVIPVGAFQGGPNGQLDVEAPTRTPVIQAVAGTPIGTNVGPYIGTLSHPVTLTSAGVTQVLDPSYKIKGVPARQSTMRDYGFGTGGTVTLAPTDRSSAPVAISVSSWNSSNIVFTLPSPAPRGTPTPSGGTEWQLMVTRTDSGRSSQLGITLSYEPHAARVHMVIPPAPHAAESLLGPGAPPNTAIQDVVDAAAAGDLVIVPVYSLPWNEYIVMYKPIRLQGSGMGTVVNGIPDPQSRVPAWHNKITSLLGGDDPFVINECPGVEVIGETTQGVVVPPNANPGDYMVTTGFDHIASRIDGFLFKGCIHGGGINVYNEGHNLRISNNKIKGNMGDTMNGGISIGAPAGGGIEGGVFGEDPGAQTTYDNTNVVMEYNIVAMNSSLDGGGGICVNTGATGYKIRNNWIMGNFCFDSPGASTAPSGAGNGGGGILHMGLCPGGVIAENVIAYNEVYFGYSTGGGDGGGILIQGESDGGSPTGTSGTGNVTIIGNLIMGNLSGAGLGGGISLAGVNGPEILDTNNLPVFEGNAAGTFPDDFIGTPSADPAQWYEVDIYNNIIVNNAAGWSAGGISLQDSIKVKIIGNTIANNDACAVALNAFPPNLGVSVAQGAGIVSHRNTIYLPADLPLLVPPGSPLASGFSNPTLENNIIYHNRSYHFDYSLTGTTLNNPTNHQPIDSSGGLVLDGYVDLYVVGGGSMTPQNCILSTSGTAPSFVAAFQNTNVTALVYDEGGNNSISLRFWPISVYQNSSYSLVSLTSSGGAPQGDYHLAAALPGGANLNNISVPGFPTDFPLAYDYDDNARPTAPDIGAVQFVGGIPPFLPGVADANLAMYPGGLIPNPNNNAYAPTPAPVAGEPPHLAEGEPVAEANPLIPPKGFQPPTTLNPVWMTTPPTGRPFDGYFTFGDVQNWFNFASKLQLHDPYDSLGNVAPPIPAVTNDPVGTYLFNHLSGTWPDAPLADGEEPPAPHFTTKDMLALWNYGWVKYTQPAYYAPSDDTMYHLLWADLNKIISNNVNLYTLMAPGGVPLSGYTPSARTLTLAAQTPLNRTLLNRSVIQDAFLEVRRWYDPNVAYYQLVCGDGFAEMGDGTELYTFGFSDQTEVANNPTDDPGKGPDKIILNSHMRATLSAPTMVVKQNQEFHLNLANAGFYFRPDLQDPHTVHFHGYPNASAVFDGMPLASIAVHEGGNLSYFYNVPIEGTYFYHCHVEATEHMQMGMIGNLWVEAAQNDLPAGTPLAHLPAGKGATHQTGYKYAYNDGDGSTYYDVQYPIQVTGLDHYFHNQDFAILPLQFSLMFDDYPLFNGRGYPDTVNPGFITNSLGQPSQQVNSLITAKKGQRILVRYSNVSETEFITLTVPQIPMTIIAKDGRLWRGQSINPADTGNFVATGQNIFTRTTSYTIGGGESVDFILDTTNTQPGTYFLYGARLQELSNDQEDYGGLMTHIVITP